MGDIEDIEKARLNKRLRRGEKLGDNGNDKMLHLTAFEHYFAQGPKRTFSATAEALNVSVVTISSWNRKYRWEKKIKERELELEQKLAKRTNETILGQKVRWIKLIEALIRSTYETDENGEITKLKVKCRHVGDLKDLCEMFQKFYHIKFDDDEEIAMEKVPAELRAMWVKASEEYIRKYGGNFPVG